METQLHAAEIADVILMRKYTRCIPMYYRNVRIRWNVFSLLEKDQECNV